VRKRGQADLTSPRGKKAYDRRETIKQREAGREMERAMKGRRQGKAK
jgi:SsrA-binding protein